MSVYRNVYSTLPNFASSADPVSYTVNNNCLPLLMHPIQQFTLEHLDGDLFVGWHKGRLLYDAEGSLAYYLVKQQSIRAHFPAVLHSARRRSRRVF